MKKAIITIGVSASGKSTWSKHFCEMNSRCAEINRDMIREQIWRELGNTTPMTWHSWNKKYEKKVTDIQYDLIHFYKNNNDIDTIIISDTNLIPKYRERLAVELTDNGFIYEFKLFPVSFEEAIKRDNGRPNGVGYSVIANQFKLWNKQFELQYKSDPTKPKTIIVDVDGTLAHIHNRSPYDWNKVNEDIVDEEIKFITNRFYEYGYKIIVLSGRDDCCYDLTKDWLDHNDIKYDLLLMREHQDMRSDTVVKEELFWKFATDYDIKLVIDDRPKIGRLWAKLGLKVMWVGNPYIEF
jgi:hypothetical protein